MKHKIGILGAGTWGMALARMLTVSGNDVTVWSALEQEIDNLSTTRVHPNLPGMTIPAEMKFTKSVEEVCTDKEILLFAVPSVFVRSTAAKARPFVPDGQIIVDVAKGIEKDTLFTMTEILADELGKEGGPKGVRLVALSGPTHAEEVAIDLPTTIVSASKDMEAARFVQTVFTNNVMRVYTNEDIKGVELSGAMKNVIALVGVIGGKGGIQRAVNVAHGLCSQVVVLGIQVHLHHGLVPLLPEQAFQGRVLLHDPLVGTAQQNPVQRAAQPLGRPQFIRPPVLQVVPAQQHFHLCRLPDALRLAHHPAPAQGARHPLTLAGGRTPGKAVGQNGKHHAIVPQQMAGIPAKLGVQLPPHASEILEVDIIITDGQLRKIGFHSTLHRGHRSFPPQAAQVMVIR